MRHVVSLSGGMSSAVAADRVIVRFGSASVQLWTADTLWEDEDLWRFHAECSARWGITPIMHAEGRSPLQVAEDEHIIPNQKIAPCSRRLKIVPFTKWLIAQPKPMTVHIGMDWFEGDRKQAPKRAYEAIDGVTVDFPLDWRPLETRPHEDVVRSWGIEPSRAYALGFGHSNCGGRCVRQGTSEWHRLWINYPARFTEVEVWEEAQRAKGEPWNRYAIAKRERGGETFPVTLRELRNGWEQANDRQPELFVVEDRSFCLCQTPDDFEARR